MMTINTFVVLLIVAYCHAEKSPEVDTPLGKVRGYYKTSYEGRTISAFEGIPFAKPPIGNLRFKNPQEIEPWKGTWEAVNTYVCPQLEGFGGHTVTGDEDCLYINVYTPSEQPSLEDNLDVVVSIHGGAFVMGSGNLNKPDFLLDIDLVFVSFNYRLGPLGFLSTQDDVVPGNMGLKDQAFALKWVQKNIKSFGGNPDSVTIDGVSAGGASVHYHYISPLSKGLFHRGFSHSGTVLVPWALHKAPLETARKLAAAVGCVDDSSTKNLVECLKQRPARQLIENTNVLNALGALPLAPFAPVIESRTKGAFVPDHPYKLLATGEINDVPWINSYTTEEGTIPGLFLLPQLDTVDEQWESVAQHVLDCNYTLSNAEKLDTFRKVREFYFGNERVSFANVDKFIKLCTDRFFKLDAIRASQTQSKVAKSPVYTLLYAYNGSRKLVDLFSPVKLDIDFGVGHGDDLMYLYFASPNITLSVADEKLKNLWLELFSSYAATGVPKIKGVNWEPTGRSKELTYLELISADKLNLKTDDNFLETLKFWDSLPLRENKQIVILKEEL